MKVVQIVQTEVSRVGRVGASLRHQITLKARLSKTGQRVAQVSVFASTRLSRQWQKLSRQANQWHNHATLMFLIDQESSMIPDPNHHDPNQA